MPQFKIIERVVFVHFVDAENEDAAKEAISSASLNEAIILESEIESVALAT